jgi:hypothetical protein
MDKGEDQKQRNREVAGRCRRKIRGGTATKITFGRLSCFTNTSATLSTMREE